MNNQRMQFSIGVVTLIAGFALGAIIIWFGEFQVLLRAPLIYYVSFKYAPGIEPQVPVRRAGVRIGEVRAVEYVEEKSVVMCTIAVEPKYPLRLGDQPVLKTTLLGDTYLEIVTLPSARGKANRPLVEVDSVLEGRSPIDTSETVAKAADMVPNANATLVSFQETSGQWNEIGERVNRILEANEARINIILQQVEQATEEMTVALQAINGTFDEATQRNVRITMENVRQASEDFKPITKQTDETIQQLQETLTTLDDVATDLKSITQPLSKRGDTIAKNTDEGLNNLNLLSTELRQILFQYQKSNGTIRQLIESPALYQNLDGSSASLNEALLRLEPIMKDLQVFADKIARHPGELGVQGVLTRDKGLKNVEPGTLDKKGHKRRMFGTPQALKPGHHQR